VYEFTNKRKVCKNCFARYFQKKFLTTVRKFGMIKKNEVIGYENKGDFRGVVLEELLKMFSQRGIVEIVRLSAQSSKKVDRLALSSTIDFEADKFVHILFNGNAKDLKELAPVEKKIIKPLYLFLDKEVMLYANIKKLKFKIVKEKNDKISLFIDGLEKKHPEIKRAIVNSYLELE